MYPPLVVPCASSPLHSIHLPSQGGTIAPSATLSPETFCGFSTAAWSLLCLVTITLRGGSRGVHNHLQSLDEWHLDVSDLSRLEARGRVSECPCIVFPSHNGHFDLALASNTYLVKLDEILFVLSETSPTFIHVYTNKKCHWSVTTHK